MLKINSKVYTELKIKFTVFFTHIGNTIARQVNKKCVFLKIGRSLSLVFLIKFN